MLTSPPESRVISPSADRTQAPYGEDLLSLPDSRSERGLRNLFVNLEIHGHMHIKYLRIRQKVSLQTFKYKHTTFFKINRVNKMKTKLHIQKNYFDTG